MYSSAQFDYFKHKCHKNNKIPKNPNLFSLDFLKISVKTHCVVEIISKGIFYLELLVNKCCCHMCFRLMNGMKLRKGMYVMKYVMKM